MEYDSPAERFLITSLREGVITEVKIDGTHRTFIEDDEIISAIGIRVDRTRNRILVCNSDPGAGVKTKMSGSILRPDGQPYDSTHYMEPEEIADVAVFLASEASSAVHGQSINVYGGVDYQ